MLRRKIQELEGRLTDAKGEVSDALKEKVATLSTELESANKMLASLTEAQTLAAKQAAYELATARAQTETKIRAIALLHERIAAFGDVGALALLVEREKEELRQQIVKLNTEVEGRDKIMVQKDAQMKKEKADMEAERKTFQNSVREAKKLKEDLAALSKENESNIDAAQSSREKQAALQLVVASLQQSQLQLTTILLSAAVLPDADPTEVTELMIAAVAGLKKVISDATATLAITTAKFDAERELMIQSMDGPMALMREKLANRERALDKYNDDLSSFEEAKSKAAYLETLQMTSGRETERLSAKVKEQQRAITVLTHDLEDAKRLVEEMRKRRVDFSATGLANGTSDVRRASAMLLGATSPAVAVSSLANPMPMANMMQYGVSAGLSVRATTAEELKQQVILIPWLLTMRSCALIVCLLFNWV